MAKGVIVLVLLIIMFILGVLIFFQLRPEPEKKPGLKNELASVKPGQTPAPESESDNLTAEEEVIEGSTEPVEIVEGVSGGGGGGEGGDDEDTSSEEPPELPDDLYTAPCGTYFTAYNICAGSCDNGICTQEGRSCYCKLQE